MNQSTHSPTQPNRMDDETWRFVRGLWAETRTELDRSLLLTSSAGVGFCSTILFDKELSGDYRVMWSIFTALIAFSVSAAAILLVFKFNASYLHRLMNEPFAPNSDPLLGALDWAGISAFILAVLAIFASIFIHLFL